MNAAFVGEKPHVELRGGEIARLHVEGDLSERFMMKCPYCGSFIAIDARWGVVQLHPVTFMGTFRHKTAKGPCHYAIIEGRFEPCPDHSVTA